MKKFTYKNKKTGRKVYSDTPINDFNFVLVSAVRNTKIRSDETVKK